MLRMGPLHAAREAMSYILDALKRAERERKQGQVSVLDEIPTAQVAAAPARRLPRVWLPVAIGVVVLALLVYTVAAWRHHDGKDAVAPQLIAGTPPAAPAGLAPPPPPPPPSAARPDAPPAAAPAATIEDGAKIATLDDVYGEPPPAPPGGPAAGQAPGPPPDAGISPPPGPPPGADAGQLRHMPRPPPTTTIPPPDSAAAPGPDSASQAPPPAPAPAPANDNAAADVTQAQAQQAQDDSAPAQTSAQDQLRQTAGQEQPLREMPESFRANFPAFTVDVHAYNNNPQRRFVMVSGKRYHEGDTLAEGPRIVAIVPNGMVLDWQGQQVLYAINH